MTDTPVTDLEALKLPYDDEDLRYNDEVARIAEARFRGWNDAIDHIAELIRTGRIRLGGDNGDTV